jgi:(1->4)-alpha-D-glucan 1-alpha-D-glucosylmutase
MCNPSVPTATYRLQFNDGFRFVDATVLAEYLAKLGITDIYASPIFTSRKGSNHGYDVTDPTHLDPDIGTAHEFEQFQEELVRHGLRLVLDIVPNHMAASSENRWWMDVLENGRESGFASYFDIDWYPPSRNLEGKVLLPVLGRPFGEALDRGELRIVLHDGKFFVQYFDSIFPLMPRSYRRILKHRVEELRKTLSEEAPAYQEYSGIIAALSSLSETARSEAEKRVQTDAIRERLQRLLSSHPEIAEFLNANVAEFNGRSGEAVSFCSLENLLAEQNYLLAYWQDANEGINYRRFFAITDLVGVRAEDPIVFEATHDQVLHLAARAVVRGVRVDHVDGLRDPVGYLNRLQQRLLDSKGEDADCAYVLVEKILSQDEELPDDWPASGTTGYEYLNLANGIFVNPAGAQQLEKKYFEFIGREINFADIVYEKKKLIMATLLRVEMRSLGRQIANLAARDRYARNLLRPELMDALIEATACLPVYRTYIRNLEVPANAKELIEGAVAEARRRRPRLSAECFDFVRDVLTLANLSHVQANQREEWLAFVMRWQQFTGPITAKGVEDTAIYVYYPLLSLNEVGGNPEPSKTASRESFYKFIDERQKRWPHALNAASTHDTKRSEGVRARLNVLSEIPDDYAQEIATWAGWNEALKETVDGRKVPDANEEYLIYQTLVGLWPADVAELPSIADRLQAYVIKAIREAMINTRWMEPNEPYEQAVSVFLTQILSCKDNPRFSEGVSALVKRIEYAGMMNSLGQTLLKIVCPGVPDFYQGTELWDFHLVDPDNRAGIDYKVRTEALKTLTETQDKGIPQIAADVSSNWQDGRIKLFMIWRALGCRRVESDLFRSGEFVPLEVAGERSEHVIAFLRRHEGRQALVVIPRWVVNWSRNENDSLWKGTRLKLPMDSPGSWRSVFTERNLENSEESGQRVLAVDAVLKDFPVGLLTGGR